MLCANPPAAGTGKCAHGSARAVHMHAQLCRLVGLRCRTCHFGGWWRPSWRVWVAGPGIGGVQRHMLRGAQTPVVARSSWRKNGVKCGLLLVKQLVRTQAVLLRAATTILHYLSPPCALRAALAFIKQFPPPCHFQRAAQQRSTPIHASGHLKCMPVALMTHTCTPHNTQEIAHVILKKSLNGHI